MALGSGCVPGLSLAQRVASPGRVISLGGAGVAGRWGRGSCRCVGAGTRQSEDTGLRHKARLAELGLGAAVGSRGTSG